ncbi:hybrid sensor histidine kinase/response regulator [Massilia oculi]|uniref:hybrid sensor histidine kinase/response regulator n=1 Tax=Massilia oculi TaxID=945844 RepID=UPI0028A85C31|nr:PAS domain S-box protein [Massilia oculi]
MPPASLPFLPATDETSRLILAFPWNTTSLGPIEGWPTVLKTTVALIMATPAPIVTLWGEDGYMIYNDAYRVFAGGRHPVLLGSKVREGWPEVADFNDNVMKVGLAGGTLSYQDQELTLHRSGQPEQVWMNLDYSPIRDQEGRIAGVMSVVVETSSKVKAERHVRAERERLNTMFEQAPGFICLLEGSEHRYALANDAYRALTGHRPLLGMPVAQAVPELAEHGIVEVLDRCFADGTTFRAEGVEITLRNPGLDEPVRTFIDFVLQPLRDANGAVFATFVEGNDVTERAVAERALRASEARFRTFAQAMPNHVWAAREDGSVEWINDRVHEYASAGAAPLAMLGHGWGPLLHPDDEARFRTLWDASVASGAPLDAEIRLRRHDGEYRWHLVRARRSPGEAGDGVLWIGSSIDIEEQKRASEALAAVNATLEERVGRRTAERDRMWRLSKDIMLVADLQGVLSAVNPAFTTILGWLESEVLATPLLDLVHPDDREPTTRQIEALRLGGQLYRFENRYRRKNGSWCHLSWTASPDDQYIHAVGRDISTDLAQMEAMRRTEAALQQAQKMETIGKLTGGVAHDFNNLLQVIGGNLQLIARRADGLPEIRKRVENAMSGVERGAKLASSLLSFARRQPLEPKAVKIGRLLGSMEDMMRRSLGEEIDVEMVISGGLWTTEVDPAQLENAILNLAINARDAMDGAGKLTLEVANAALDAGYCATHPEVAPGQYVLLAVSDTGSGMPQEVIDQAFEPFFSTKPEGKGTGLGLSMVYGLVKQSGGHVKIYSEVGEGTTVKIYLPRSLQAEDHAGEQLAQPATGGHETVLVVEDDEQVRLTVVDMLADLGYRVLRANDAASALTVIDSGIHVDLLFTDVVMPGPLRSPELARKARERLPNVAVLFTSGYTENAIVHGGRLDPGVELLGKPYTRDALARKVRHVLANQQQKNAALQPSPGAAAPAGSKARVLLVEDEDDIRENTAELMRIMGYEVLEAASAEAALALLERRPDIVLTDLQLPGLGGEALARLVREKLPRARIAFMSGASHASDAADALLPKPYDAGQLEALLDKLA